MSARLLELSGVVKRFDPAGPAVVDRMCFHVERGEIFALLGPSGCGKTTTLRLVAGFERAERGEILLEGRSIEGPGIHVAPERRGVGFVFQDYALFPHLSVAENAVFGLRGGSKRERQLLAEELLDRVGLAGFGSRRPSELSGGQQQRVALARSMAPRPRLVLLDEPFNNLDADLREATRGEVRALLKESGMTAVLVTHDREEAMRFADRIGVMRQGRLEQIGPPEELYRRPRTLFVARFLGGTNLLPGFARGSVADTPLGRVALLGVAEGRVLLSLRPEHLLLEAAHSGLPAGMIVTREFRGPETLLRVRAGEREYVAMVNGGASFVPGDRVCLSAREPAVPLAWENLGGFEEEWTSVLEEGEGEESATGEIPFPDLPL